MQLHLILNGDSLALPVNCRPLIHGMTYRALSASTAYAEQLHSCGRDEGERPFKGFTFSRLAGKYTMDGHRILFCDDVKLEIRSCEGAFMIDSKASYPCSFTMRVTK